MAHRPGYGLLPAGTMICGARQARAMQGDDGPGRLPVAYIVRPGAGGRHACRRLHGEAPGPQDRPPPSPAIRPECGRLSAPSLADSRTHAESMPYMMAFIRIGNGMP